MNHVRDLLNKYKCYVVIDFRYIVVLVIFLLCWKIYYKEQIDDIIYSYLHEKRKIKDAYIKKSEEEE